MNKKDNGNSVAKEPTGCGNTYVQVMKGDVKTGDWVGGSQPQLAPPSEGTKEKQSGAGRTLFKQTTQSELEERRAKGLCFRCEEKFKRGHRCAPYTLQVMTVDDSDEEKEPYLQVKPWDLISYLNWESLFDLSNVDYSIFIVPLSLNRSGSYHVGSWFSQIIEASRDFVTNGRISWVEVEGVPFKLWSHNTFKRITDMWGMLLDVDDQEETCYHSKRLCIHTKSGRNILESFKIIHRGKAHWIRACETPGWVPDFVDDEDQEDDMSNDGGGSILGILDEVVKVGQVKGYNM
nr:nucleotide-binding alpha-beta plait domain-containing protein [Tanacetum cinerariifolium]